MQSQIIQKDEGTAAYRRVYLELVQFTDGKTALTGQTGTPFLTKGGAAPAATTNSLVEVSSGNQPGLYYVELTAAEVNAVGNYMVSIKTASSIMERTLVTVVDYSPFAVDKTGVALASDGFNLITGYTP